MALQMAYTTPAGLTASASYWVIAQVNVNPIYQIGNLVFNGYASQAAYEAGNPTIAQKSYSINPQNYAAFLAATNLTTAVYTPAYEFAQQIDDTPGVDGNGNPIMQSFFAGATVV